MDAYPNGAERRVLGSEIVDYAARRTGSRLVYGFSTLLDAGDAVTGGERVAGFMETHDRREWLLPLTASRGLVWHTQAVPETGLDRVSFLLSIGFGNGSPLPQPTGCWDLFVEERLAVSVRVVKHSQRWRCGEGVFAFAANRIEAAPPFASLTLSSVIRDESFAAFGPALLSVPTSWVTPGQPARITVQARAEARSTQWLQLATAPGIIEQSDVYRAVEQMHPQPRQIHGRSVFFGDIHTHSGQVGEDALGNKGCGARSREQNYEYARGPGGLDFYALTDHEFQIEPARIGDYLALADAHNRDCEFVCLPGYEFTSLLYGHRNIYFRTSGGTVVNSTRPWSTPTKDPARAVTPAELWRELERSGVPFLSVPHHPSAASHPFNWATFEPRHDRLVEVYSCWGSSEYYGDSPRGVSDRYRSLDVRAALGRGCRFGLIASSDGHDGHPGNAQSPLFKHHHLFHHGGSGWVAAICPELTRAAVFDALYRRSCYGTTGVPILLWFEVNGHPMGSELDAAAAGSRPRLTLQCQGTNGIDHIRVVRNGQVVHTVSGYGEPTLAFEWEDETPRRDLADCYYVRVVQVDRESAWSSPVWLSR